MFYKRAIIVFAALFLLSAGSLVYVGGICKKYQKNTQKETVMAEKQNQQQNITENNSKEDNRQPSEEKKEEKQEKIKPEAWQIAYYDFLMALKLEHLESLKDLMNEIDYEETANVLMYSSEEKKYRFALGNINDDDIPELMVAIYDIPGVRYAYFTYIDGKILGLNLNYDDEILWAWSEGTKDLFMYIENENIVVNEIEMGGGLEVLTRIFLLDSEWESDIIELSLGQPENLDYCVVTIDGKDATEQERNQLRNQYIDRCKKYSVEEGSMYQLTEKHLRDVIGYEPEKKNE